MGTKKRKDKKTGQPRLGFPPKNMPKICWECGGTGMKGKRTCTRCKGTGEL